MVSQALPNFLVIGEQKCGTGWLRDRLCEHPDVFFAPREINFFNSRRNFAIGVDRYKENFSSQDVSAIGEKSPEYFWQNSGREDYNQDIFSLIDQTLPEVRVILALRSPVERALSATLHHVRHRGRRIHPALVRTRPISEVLFSPDQDFRRLGILERGFYYQRVSEAMHVFGERLLVLIFEDEIVADPVEGLDQVCRHIGVDTFGGFSYQSNEKAHKPSYGAILRSHQLPVARPLIRRLDFGDPFKLNVTETCRELLWDHYLGDVKQLENLLAKPPLFGRPS